jgi:hypothetical protein
MIPKYGPLWFGAFRLCEKLEARHFSRICASRECLFVRCFVRLVFCVGH